MMGAAAAAAGERDHVAPKARCGRALALGEARGYRRRGAVLGGDARGESEGGGSGWDLRHPFGFGLRLLLSFAGSREDVGPSRPDLEVGPRPSRYWENF